MRTLAIALFATLLAPPAQAQDFSAEAKDRMGLSFDLDEVQGRLAAPFPSPDMPAPGQLSPLPLEPNSEVDTVTVYRDRALVTRVLEAGVGSGPQEIVFEGLPLGLDASTLHASLRSGDGRIVGVELESGLGEVEETERIESIREDLETHTEELGLIRDRIEALLAQRAYLRATLMRGNGDAAPPRPVEIKSTLEYVGEAEQEIARQLREEQDRAEELDEEIAPLLVKLDNPKATGQRVRVDVEMDGAGEAGVALHYQVHGARWVPSYNARLDADTHRVELEYYGVVSQTTGEDWTDASLLLSTARPSTSSGLPELGTWQLGRSGVQSNLQAGSGHVDTGRRPATGGHAPVPEGVVASEMSADVQGGGTVVFAIPGERTVLGDGSSQRLPVGSQTFEATVELAAAPKLIPEVFRRARIRYDGEIPLIPGSVSSYVGADYVGSETIDAVVPGEALELSFGTDDRLKITRRLASRDQEFVGLGKRNVRYTFDFRITLANFTDQPQTVEVVDQLPVSQADKVEVEIEEISQGRLPADEQTPGVVRWRPTVPASGEITLRMKFSVTAPVEEAQQYMQDMELMY